MHSATTAKSTFNQLQNIAIKFNCAESKPPYVCLANRETQLMHGEGLQLQCPVALRGENGTIGTILINTAVANEGLELVGFV